MAIKMTMVMLRAVFDVQNLAALHVTGMINLGDGTRAKSRGG